MTQKNRVQVVIDGKILTMGGYEDDTHIQKIAAYVNKTIQNMKEAGIYRTLPGDLKHIFIHCTIADELIQEKERAAQLEADLLARDEELSILKQELVELRMKQEKNAYNGKRK